jgi:membrane protease YdiL (CAAX protease family)
VGLGKSFGYFVFYELVLVAFFTAVYEFFFRGFVLFHFAPDLKYWAIVVQYGLFLLLLLVTGSSFWALAPYIIFAPFAGWIAYKSDSLAYSFFGQLIFIIIIDTYIVVSLAK